MINHRRLVGDASLTACHHVRKVIVLLESLARLSEDGVELSPERTILDVFDFTRQIDPAVPNFHWRQLRQAAHASSIGFYRCCRGCPRPFLGISLGECSHCHTRGYVKSTPGKVIIDVEQNVLLWSS